MKNCRKLPEPPALTAYRQAKPAAIWDQMRNDPFDDGQQAYLDIKHTLVKGQRCLCAFCEISIADNTDDATIEAKKHMQRVEHFHPKSDQNGPINWALHWPNLWAVCLGGSQRYAGEDHYLEPLPDNLSCDAFKDHQIDTNKLPNSPEGWILAPDEVPAFPLLFQFDPDGKPEPHTQNCATLELPNHHYQDTATLVSKTIEHLNLGCMRLNRNRLAVKTVLEKQIKAAREQSPGIDPQIVLFNLAQRWFSDDVNSPWPEFFSLIRWRLGDAAEIHLQSIHYGE